MIAVAIALSMLSIALSAFNFIYALNEIRSITEIKSKQDVLLNSVANLSLAQSKLSESTENIEDNIAAKIEKRWEDGLQNMINFNPFLKLYGGNGGE